MPRISLRQLLLLTAAVALAIVSLRYASDFWQGLIGVFAILALIAAILTGIFDRGPRQVFAIGFAGAMATYGLLVACGHQEKSPIPHNIEFRIGEGKYPTTALLRCGYQLIAYYVQVDSSGRPVSDAEAQRMWAAWNTAGGPPPGLSSVAHPDQAFFTTVGHFWWGLLFGFVGGHFARFVYLRHTEELAAQRKA